MIHPRQIFVGILVTLAVLSAAHGDGPSGSGGGEDCEKRFKRISADILNWVEKDGGERLAPQLTILGLTPEKYKKRMTGRLQKFQVKCVDERDPDYHLVRDSAKGCWSWVDQASDMGRVVCDLNRFYLNQRDPENEPNQYPITHHEFATMTAIEVPKGNDSNYDLSNEITHSLGKKLVYMLEINPLARAEETPRVEDAKILQYERGQQFVINTLGNKALSDVRAMNLALAVLANENMAQAKAVARLINAYNFRALNPVPMNWRANLALMADLFMESRRIIGLDRVVSKAESRNKIFSQIEFRESSGPFRGATLKTSPKIQIYKNLLVDTVKLEEAIKNEIGASFVRKAYNGASRDRNVQARFPIEVEKAERAEQEYKMGTLKIKEIHSSGYLFDAIFILFDPLFNSNFLEVTALFTGANGDKTEYDIELNFDYRSKDYNFSVIDARGAGADSISPRSLSGWGLSVEAIR